MFPKNGTILKGDFIFQPSFFRGELRTLNFQGSTITPKTETTIVSSMISKYHYSTYNYDLCLHPHIPKASSVAVVFFILQTVWWLQAAATLIMGLTTGIVCIFCLLHSYPPVQQVAVEGQRCWVEMVVDGGMMKGHMQFR